jgi:hypothetical protein
VARSFFLIVVIRSSSGLSVAIALSMSAISVCVVCLYSTLVDEKWLKNEEKGWTEWNGGGVQASQI